MVATKVKVVVSEDVLGEMIDTDKYYEISKEFEDGEIGLAPYRSDHMGSALGYYA